MEWWLPLLSYAVFAVLQVGYRLFGIFVRKWRWEAASKNIQPYHKNVMGDMRKNSERRHDYLLELFEGRSKTCRFTMGPHSGEGAVVTMDPKVVEHILHSRFDVYIKRLPDRVQAVDPFLMLMGDGIFAANHGPHSTDKGDSWWHQRKLATNIFFQRNFRDFFVGVFVKNGHILLNQLNEACDNKETVDIQDKFFKYTMDSFGEIGFGTKFGTLEGNDYRLATSFDACHAIIIPFFQFVSASVQLSSILFPFPFDKLYIQYLWLFNKYLKTFNTECKTLTECCDALIDKRQKDKDVETSEDLLARFLQCKQPDGSPLPQQMLRNIILNLLIAGRDTTACTLSWMFYQLCLHKEVQEQLQQEVDDVLRGAEPDFDNVKTLKLLHGAVYETLRLHPPVPRDTKVAAVDDTLPDGSVVTKGTAIIFFPWGMGRDEDLYPDPLKFMPERWLDMKAKSEYEFPVFQGGPRLCLGKEMAILEAKVLAAMLLQNYTMEAAPGQTMDVAYSKTLTMSITDGFKVRLTRREPEN